MSTQPFRVGFVTASTPDKWAWSWREQRREPLELVPVTDEEQESLLRRGQVDMVIARLPVDRDGLHSVRLYDEVPVVVAGRDHFVAAAEEVVTDDLSDEQLVLPHAGGWTPDAEQLVWPPMTTADAAETVAAGTGILIVPMAIARLHARKDVVHRPVTDLEPTTIALVWLVERDDELTQAFVGVVRGRTARSSRG